MDAPHTNTPVQNPHPPYDPDRLPSTPSNYTKQQEREMGARDEAGRTIQPVNAALMIGLMFIGVAGVLVVVAVVLMRVTE